MPLQLPFLILKFWSFLSFYYSYFLSFLGIHYGVLSTRASKSLPLLYQRLSLLSIKRFVKVTRLSRINSVNAPSSQKKMTGLKVLVIIYQLWHYLTYWFCTLGWFWFDFPIWNQSGYLFTSEVADANWTYPQENQFSKFTHWYW